MPEFIDVPKDRKMTFVEYVAYEETDDRNTIDASWLDHWKKNLSKMLDEDSVEKHFGDCTNDPCPCNLCCLKTLLVEYKEYFFNKNVEMIMKKFPEQRTNDEHHIMMRHHGGARNYMLSMGAFKDVPLGED